MTAPARIYRRSELEAVDEGCLHRYNEIWNKGVDDTSDVAIVGISAHKVKHRYILKLVEAQIPQDAELAREAFVEGIAAARTPSRLIPQIKALWDWHAETWELPLEQFVATEEKQEQGSVVFTPDLVTANPTINELEVHDDKTGWQPPISEPELRVLYQARFYVYYAMQRWPNFAKYRFTIHAWRFKKIISTVFTPSDLDSIESEIRASVSTIEQCHETGSWPAVAGPSCHFCDLPCPIMQETLEVPKRILLYEDAQKVAAFVTAGDQLMRQAKKALKGYVSSHGPVDVHGVLWDNRETVSRSYPVDYLNKVLTETGSAGAYEDSAALGLTVSQSALKKLFKRFPKLEEMLAPVAIEKSGWRFSARQPGAETEDPE